MELKGIRGSLRMPMVCTKGQEVKLVPQLISLAPGGPKICDLTESWRPPRHSHPALKRRAKSQVHTFKHVKHVPKSVNMAARCSLQTVDRRLIRKKKTFLRKHNIKKCKCDGNYKQPKAPLPSGTAVSANPWRSPPCDRPSFLPPSLSNSPLFLLDKTSPLWLLSEQH